MDLTLALAPAQPPGLFIYFVSAVPRSPASLFAFAEPAHADPVLTLGRDVKDFGCPFDRSLFVGRVHLAQVLGALADDVYGPAGHRSSTQHASNIHRPHFTPRAVTPRKKLCRY